MINHEWFYPITGFSDKPSTCGALERISRSQATSDVVATSRCRLLDVDVMGASWSSFSDSSPSVGPGTLTTTAMGSGGQVSPWAPAPGAQAMLYGMPPWIPQQPQPPPSTVWFIGLCISRLSIEIWVHIRYHFYINLDLFDLKGR
jgi:hypothetical protein